MSFGFSPQSVIAFSAASACSWICDISGMTPSFVVSAAPTTATVLCGIGSAFRRTEEGQSDRVVLLGEYDFKCHVELQCFRRLRTLDDVGHHARAFGELHHGNGVGRLETGHLAVMDHVAIQDRFAGSGEYADFARGAFWAERSRREINMTALTAALQTQFAGLCTVPEVLRFRRGLRQG